MAANYVNVYIKRGYMFKKRNQFPNDLAFISL